MIRIKKIIYREKIYKFVPHGSTNPRKLKTKQDKDQVHNKIKHEARGICNSSDKIEGFFLCI
jgi:hypothetical protein